MSLPYYHLEKSPSLHKQNRNFKCAITNDYRRGMDWIREIDLKPIGPSVSMGVRKLWNRPWLFEDEHSEKELALKAEFSEDPRREVFLSQSGTQEASEYVISLIKQTGRELIDLDNLHPFERAGLSVQEDLCLVKQSSEGWVLEAASLCFPSRWRLADKIGRNMAAVHGPVEGYEEVLEKKVNAFFDRLGPEPVWRRNWFVHPDDGLYQPDRPVGGDPIIPSTDVGEKLFVRSERQTLRALELPGWILFTIRVQQTQLKNLVTERGDEFTKWLREAPESHHRQKGLQAEQVSEILDAIS